jgi:hypothetical protein
VLDLSNVPSCLSRNDLLGSGPPEPPGSPTGVDRDLSAKLGAGSRPRSCNPIPGWRSHSYGLSPSDSNSPRAAGYTEPRAQSWKDAYGVGGSILASNGQIQMLATYLAPTTPSFSHKRTGAASAATSFKSPKQYARRNQTASLTQGQFSAGDPNSVSVIPVKPDFRSHCSTEQGKADPELATRRHKAH